MNYLQTTCTDLWHHQLDITSSVSSEKCHFTYMFNTCLDTTTMVCIIFSLAKQNGKLFMDVTFCDLSENAYVKGK